MKKIKNLFINENELSLFKAKIKCFLRRKHNWENPIIRPPYPIKVKCVDCGKIKYINYK